MTEIRLSLKPVETEVLEKLSLQPKDRDLLPDELVGRDDPFSSYLAGIKLSKQLAGREVLLVDSRQRAGLSSLINWQKDFLRI
jgi:hypothetical protein